MGISYLSILSWIIVIALIVLFVISFAMFIRRILVNQAQRNENQIKENHHLRNIEEKLDRIIANQEKHQNL